MKYTYPLSLDAPLVEGLLLESVEFPQIGMLL